MGDDIGSGWVCFDFCCGAALLCWVCRIRLESDLRRQSVAEPKLMSSPINYPALWHLNMHQKLSFCLGQSTFSRIFEPQVFWKKYIPIWRVFLHKTFKFVFEMIIVQMMVHFGSGVCAFSTNLTLNQIIFMSFYMIIELVYPSKTKITMMTFVRLVLRMKFNTMSFK